MGCESKDHLGDCEGMVRLSTLMGKSTPNFDLLNIKPGDEVSSNLIVAHILKPKSPPQLGDTVRQRGSNIPGYLIAIDAGTAWVRWTEVDGHIHRSALPLSELETAP